MDDGTGAPALAPANPFVFGLRLVAIVELAGDTFVQGNLQGVGTQGLGTASVQDHGGEADHGRLPRWPDPPRRTPMNDLGSHCRSRFPLQRGPSPGDMPLHVNLASAQPACPSGRPGSRRAQFR